MSAPETADLGGRLFQSPPAGFRGSVGAALLLSGAVHAVAIAWGLSGAAERTMAVDAGATTVLEVTLVEGSADGAAGAGGTLPSQPAPVATTKTPATATAPAIEAAAERAVSADRLPPPVVAADASASALPPAPEAAPVPPPKPPTPVDAARIEPDAARPATPVKDAPQLAALPGAGPIDTPVKETPVPDAAGGGAPGATGGGTEGAAPHADNPAPGYPLAARRRGQEGRVLLKVEVLPSGDAGAVTVERSSGVASLDEAAADAVRRWRFRPARRNGTPVRATVEVPIRFALQ